MSVPKIKYAIFPKRKVRKDIVKKVEDSEMTTLNESMKSLNSEIGDLKEKHDSLKKEIDDEMQWKMIKFV